VTASRAEPRVHVLGITPGVQVLPSAVREAILGSELLAGSERHLALIPEFSGEVVHLSAGVGALARRLAGEERLRAAILASGDPGFFGIAATLLRELPRPQVKIWPAVSSMQLAFARAGEPWSDAHFTSVHGRPLESLAHVLGTRSVGVFTDAENSPARIAEFLAEAGWDDLEMIVAEDLGQPTERLTRGPVGQFLGWQGSDLNVVLLLRPDPDPQPLGPGLPEDAFSHSRGLITKAEVRAIALGLLHLPRSGVLWDVGAGSGSVAVEACLAAPGLRVYAVERTEAGIDHIRENRRRFRVAGLIPVHGQAPAALTGLPDPAAVYVGGSGGSLGTILDACRARLGAGGILLVAAVLVDTLCEATAWGRRANLEPELTQISCARSRRLGDRLRLEPENPVTLVRFVMPREVASP
jgi:precorrin-6Y C5,15-methyltransferase (decarboxylating)